ncbi:MAG TPA: hypothetical protein VKD90_27480 [Gemmataceae bacterium]|nr:hypothetical protein [Gemmataceae bacterium]
MNQAWRRLRIGDRIRVVRMPSDADATDYFFAPETRRLYRKLIARGRSLRIFQIDEHGLPWVACRFHRRDGSWEHHWLAVNDDSWVPVRRRRRKR